MNSKSKAMKTSVIIPAYNAEKTIGKCLQSLKAQAAKPLEIIVVDDGSTDSTREMVKKFRGIELLKQENSGPAKARNFGAENAKGNVLIFTDSDCIANKNFLGEMTKPLADNEIVGVQGKYKTEQKELVARLTQLEIEQRHEKMARQKHIDFIGSYAAAYRKNIFTQMRGFDTSFPMASGEDTDLSFRISRTGKKMVFAENAVVWHTHPTSLWKYLKVKFFRAFWRTKIYQKHKDKVVNDSYTSKAVKMQAVFLSLAILSGISGIFFNPFFYIVTGIFVIAILASSATFVLWAMKKDSTIAVIAPFAVFLRTIFFVAGLLFGALRQIRNSI